MATKPEYDPRCEEVITERIELFIKQQSHLTDCEKGQMLDILAEEIGCVKAMDRVFEVATASEINEILERLGRVYGK